MYSNFLKVEVKLKKSEALHWSKLEKSPNDIVVKKTSHIDLIEEKKRNYNFGFKNIFLIFFYLIVADYPSSSRKAKNWDKIAADVTAEEKDEKLEGDAALNKYFFSIKYKTFY